MSIIKFISGYSVDVKYNGKRKYVSGIKTAREAREIEKALIAKRK